MKSIDVLLDLDGVIIEQAGGHWTKFEVRRAPKCTEEIPHGIRYSLTLHNRYGERIMGFDNAHAIKTKHKYKHRGRKIFDHRHKHKNDEGTPYEFIDAHQLLKDFWSDVDKILSALGVNEEQYNENH
jgi:hypothetical protein